MIETKSVPIYMTNKFYLTKKVGKSTTSPEIAKKDSIFCRSIVAPSLNSSYKLLKNVFSDKSPIGGSTVANLFFDFLIFNFSNYMLHSKGLVFLGGLERE